ncbi:aldehyde dehydrogenase family protein [Novosphingobium malaysiense]|uniref:Aldehyde dehydrogenase domain-containing protein n=1 Tax=Novosphingobium malaysiense TaxID=1348853 RepID=A0A0B1ZIB6_9SPHN|nr:aldehyde dehydrogenase family protein [Novosphingobium malaysiense]KHK90252.1 hypothetical protein LK12_16530 [Novosphingobium malaysiense]
MQDGIDAGASVVAGGKPVEGPGFFFEPAVVCNVRRDMRLYREEIFGPVATVMPFDEEDDVVREANDTPYGLAGAIWTNDLSRARRLAGRIDAGTIWVNCQNVFNPAIPFGGFKQSGVGTEYVWQGIEAYLRTKAVVVRL